MSNETPQLRLGTRSSRLARWQADWVAERLRADGYEIEPVLVQTSGDVTTGPLDQVGEVGLFTRELQRAPLAGEIDLAVHSLKDLPTISPQGLVVAAVPLRASAQDVLVSRHGETINTLPGGSCVGTGSNRRKAQLLHYRRDLEIVGIRGNVDTRLSKLDAGQYDAIVLAEAGLVRLGWEHRISQRLPMAICLPAPVRERLVWKSVTMTTRLGERCLPSTIHDMKRRRRRNALFWPPSKPAAHHRRRPGAALNLTNRCVWMSPYWTLKEHKKSPAIFLTTQLEPNCWVSAPRSGRWPMVLRS